MKYKIIRLLNFLRLVDDNDQISITNLMMYLIMYKIFKTPALSMQDISVVVIAMGNYMYKKKIQLDKEKLDV